VADHIEYVREVAGLDHVGLGSDFDGMEPDPPPEGLENVSKFPALLAELSLRGWSEDDLAKLAGGNVLRAWAAVENAAAGIQERRGPFQRDHRGARRGSSGQELGRLDLTLPWG